MAMGMEATSKTTQKAVTSRKGRWFESMYTNVMATTNTPEPVMASVMRCSSSSKFPGPVDAALIRDACHYTPCNGI